MRVKGEIGRSLRGNVDRNHDYKIIHVTINVVPYVGTWIEIPKHQLCLSHKQVVPYVGTWIEIF